MGVVHQFVSGKAAATDVTVADGPDWDANHYYTGGALGDLLYQGSAGLITHVAAVQGVLASAGSGNVPAYTMTPSVTTIGIGAVTLDATDAGKIDGITNGTGAAGKAVVLDANGDITSGVRDFKGRNLTATAMVIGPSGSAGSTTFNFGTPGTGIFSIGNAVLVSNAGTAYHAFNYDGAQFKLSQSATIEWSPSGITASPDLSIGRGGADLLQLAQDDNLSLVRGFVQGFEMTAPSAPAANGGRIFFQDNGAGKTQLMVIFSSGAAQQIAIQP